MEVNAWCTGSGNVDLRLTPGKNSVEGPWFLPYFGRIDDGIWPGKKTAVIVETSKPLDISEQQSPYPVLDSIWGRDNIP